MLYIIFILLGLLCLCTGIIVQNESERQKTKRHIDAVLKDYLAERENTRRLYRQAHSDRQKLIRIRSTLGMESIDEKPPAPPPPPLGKQS